MYIMYMIHNLMGYVCYLAGVCAVSEEAASVYCGELELLVWLQFSDDHE